MAAEIASSEACDTSITMPRRFISRITARPLWHGLNDRGRAVIREMNRLGMVIDVSHASDEAISAAIDASAGPVVATHHGLRAVCLLYTSPSPRDRQKSRMPSSA